MFQDMLNKAYEQIVYYGPRALWAILFLLGFWFVGTLITRGLARVGSRSPESKVIVDLVAQFLSTVLLIIGIVCALGTLGVDVTALVASLGLLGFAVGFALKDVLSNVLSGVMILYYRPFWLEDKIKVSGQEGVVTDIDLRYTTLIQKDKRILIPNSSLLTNTVEILESTGSDKIDQGEKVSASKAEEVAKQR